MINNKNLGEIFTWDASVKMSRFNFLLANAFSSNLNTLYLKNFRNLGGIYKVFSKKFWKNIL